MTKSTFDEFIDRLTQDAPEADSAWVAMRHEWLQHVEDFFQTVQTFLKTYIDQGKVSISFSDKTIFEDHIGEYVVKAAIVRIGSSEVKFEPIGTNLIGARGRIDMIGPCGRIRFLLVDEDSNAPRTFKGGVYRAKNEEDINWVWKIATDPPNIEYFDMDENLFFDALMEVVNA
jgi:hypothetical protein